MNDAGSFSSIEWIKPQWWGGTFIDLDVFFWWEFFKGFMEDESFLDEKRRMQRTRAGLTVDDKYQDAPPLDQRFQFYQGIDGSTAQPQAPSFSPYVDKATAWLQLPGLL